MWQILVYVFCRVFFANESKKHKPIDENENSAHYQGLTGELTALRAQRVRR